MIKVVIDTNLFVSALLGGGKPAQLIDAWRAQEFLLVVSEQLLAELFDVLRRPKLSRYFRQEDMIALGELILERAKIVIPENQLSLCRDPKDNFLLDIAVAGNAHYLVTGDGDFLDDEILKKIMQGEHAVKIVSVSTFLDIFQQK
jgi:hypothetical protein